MTLDVLTSAKNPEFTWICSMLQNSGTVLVCFGFVYIHRLHEHPLPKIMIKKFYIARHGMGIVNLFVCIQLLRNLVGYRLDWISANW
jgi:hypothetical protein